MNDRYCNLLFFVINNNESNLVIRILREFRESLAVIVHLEQ